MKESIWSRIFPRRAYHYDPKHYRGTFLARSGPYPGPLNEGEQPARREVFCFWTGDNEITPNRRRALEVMEQKIGVPIRLITPQNLPDYIKPGYPLHKAFEYLSFVHRSDYLRAYFMLHHGGGYADIKPATDSWVEAFDALNADPDYWIASYREIGAIGVPNVKGRVGQDIQRYWNLLPGNCAFICKPYTPFVWEWHREQCARLDDYYERLKAHPGNAFGDNEGYPLPWSYIQAQIFHPVALKYHEHTLFSERMLAVFSDYR